MGKFYVVYRDYPMDDSYLAHHGIKGQRWGVRRYQNEDGSLTPEGKERYEKMGDELRDTLREYTNKIALRNYSRNDPGAVLAGVHSKADKEAHEAYYKGKKLLKKMQSEGLLNKSWTYEGLMEEYERSVLSKGLLTYRKMIQERENRDWTEDDIEWYYYMMTLKEDNKKK